MSKRFAWALCVLLGACRFGVPDLGGGDLNVEVRDLSMPADLTGDLTPVLDLSGYDGAPEGKVGRPCLRGDQCDDGFCVDGFCCDSACDGNDATNKCRTCGLAGNEGHCVFALEGTDPRNKCPQEATETCGRDGQCDGRGECRKWNKGTQCGESACSLGAVRYAPACDGLGACVQSLTVVSCGLYGCQDTKACGTTCNLITCGPRALGQPCTMNAECATGTCAQGVCCASACPGNCMSCNIPGSVGFCQPVPAGLDLLNACAQSARESCGLDGTCNGGGGCRNWQMYTPCAWSTCSGDDLSEQRSCDGLGSCRPETTMSCPSGTSCDPYKVACCSLATGTCN